MRVALACPYAWDAPGGVQTHVRQLARRLIEGGHDVLVVAPAASPPSERWVVPVGRPLRVPYNGSVAPISPWISSARAVRDALGSFRPDVVHVHEPLVPSAGLFAARAGFRPVVATFHAYADRSLLLRLSAPALRSAWERLDLRLAVSEAARAFVTQAFRGEVRVVPNGVEVRPFQEPGPAADLPPGRRILFVNRLDPRKGFRVAVAAFERVARIHRDAVLVVAGDGDERGAVSSLAPSLRERVVMLGNVPHGDLPPYHRASEVFIGPAVGGESFGIVLVEAMAAGLPVVASDIRGYREVVRAGVDGLLVPPGDPAALARGLLDVLGDERLRERLAATGRERAARFDWDVVAGEIVECYREALEAA